MKTTSKIRAHGRSALAAVGPIMIATGLAMVVVGLLGHLLGMARAAPLANPSPDPVVTASALGDASWQLVTSYGPFWAGMLLLHGLAGALLKENDSEHWISRGRVLAVIAGVLGTLGAVLEWRFTGAPAAGILVTLWGAIQLVWHPVVQPAAAPERDPQSGSSRIGLLIGMALGALALVAAAALASCTASTRQAARDHAAAGLVTAFDCEAAHFDGDALADAKHLAEAGLQRAITGTAPGDLAALKAALAADLAPIKSDLGRCGVAGALAAITGSVPARPGVATSALSAPAPDPEHVRLAAQAAARELGWAPVRNAGQVL